MPGKNHVEQRRAIMKMGARLRKEIPDVYGAFGQLNKEATADGALSKKQKELIALGISIAAHCEGCIEAHTDDALRAGATREEILECIGVAIFMGGGPSAIYGIEAYEALLQFEEDAARSRA
jgi:AhpD family alkylhydroperoxidase